MSRRTNKVGDMDARTARLFLAVRPLYYTLIAYGVVPVNFRRWPNVGLSFHPLRSTMAWALLVHATSMASAWRVWDLSLQVLSEGNPIASYANFPALLAIFHSVNVMLLVPIWCEAHRYKEVVALAKTLVGSVNEDVLGAGWPRRHTVFMSWLWALALVVAAPAITFIWQFQLTEFSGDAFQVPAHWMGNVLIGAIVGGLSLVYYIIKDVAQALAHRFAQDASQEMSCAELLRYRRAWLTLRDMLQGVMIAPISVTIVCALLVINNVLCVYHVLNCFLSGAPLHQTLALLGSSSQLGVLLIIMCWSADRAVDSVTNLARSFELVDPLSVTNFAFAREVFREALSYSPESVCVAGFWCLNRRMVLSVCLMILTYLMVLVEFRQQGACSLGSNSNSNATRIG